MENYSDILKLSKIADEIRRCKRCRLWKTRKNTVPGEGPENAKIAFIGLAPGREEDKTGRPFVGRSGKFLNKMFELAKIKRDGVFITSPIKCFVPPGKLPKKDEVEACKPYLLRQLKIIKPKLIVLLGDFAVSTLLKKMPIQKIRGKAIKINSTIYFPTFHPAAGMRFSKIRKMMINNFEILKKLKGKLN